MARGFYDLNRIFLSAATPLMVGAAMLCASADVTQAQISSPIIQAQGHAALTPPADVGHQMAVCLDVSDSMDAGEYRTAMDGVADALLSDRISERVIFGGGAAFRFYQFGSYTKDMSNDWVIVRTLPELQLLSNIVRAMPRKAQGQTYIDSCMEAAITDFDDPRIRGAKRTLNIQGDGFDEMVKGATERWRDRAEVKNIRVNALAIKNRNNPPENVRLVNGYNKLVTYDGFVEIVEYFDKEGIARGTMKKFTREFVWVEPKVWNVAYAPSPKL